MMQIARRILKKPANVGWLVGWLVGCNTKILLLLSLGGCKLHHPNKQRLIYLLLIFVEEE